MNDLISVIVPIYKVEKYLNKCVDSLINQTYRNLEIILVDDGSPDNCPIICDDYANKDDRVKVIHKSNGGLSDARNAGMKVATGKYISFIDSDDYVALDFFEQLLFTMINEDSDIVECNVVKFFEDNTFDKFKDDNDILNFYTVDAMSALIEENPFKQHVWNKLYKANLVLDVPFAVGKINEDEFWTYQIFGRAKRVTKLCKTLYYYFQRQSSIMGTSYSIRRLDALEGINNRKEYVDEHFPSLSLQAKINLFGACMFAYQSVLKFIDTKEKKEALSRVRLYLNNCKLSFSDIKKSKVTTKKYFYFAKINFYLCCKLRAILNIGF